MSLLRILRKYIECHYVLSMRSAVIGGIEWCANFNSMSVENLVKLFM